jgi:hypothetical protein
MPCVRARFGIGLVFCLAAGCASDRDAVDRRLAGLSDDIARLQATNDRLMQRMDALEVESVPAREPSPAPKAAAPAVEHPPLKVVKLEPDSGTTAMANPPREVSPAERPDAPGDRPVIRVRGKADSKADDRAPSASVRVVEEGQAK